jgi:O-antigen ligase
VTTAILIGGLVMVAAAALIMTRPGWRVPVLAFVVLALPGNVDNLLPQMHLDPHPLENALAPVVSFVDVLLAWAIVLGLRERRWERLPTAARWWLVAGLVIAGIAGASAVVAASGGLDPGAALRGFIVFLRIPAMIFVVVGLREELRADRVALGVSLAIFSLLANGVYITVSTDADRFTAATFGRNGFSVVLVVASAIAAGLGLDMIDSADGERRNRLAGAGLLALAGSAWFAAVATGSRIGLIVLVVAVGLGLFLNRSWIVRRDLRRVGVLAASTVMIAVAAGLTTSGGGRLLSAIGIGSGGGGGIPSDGDTTVEIRASFWGLALDMIEEEPLDGFGPYEWNFERYRRDPDAQVLLLDPHNAFLQIGAEYGIPLLVGYAAILAAAVLATTLAAARARPTEVGFWAVTLVVAAACAMPVSDLTNSNLFNVRTGFFLWLLLVAALTLSSWTAESARRTRLGSSA